MGSNVIYYFLIIYVGQWAVKCRAENQFCSTYGESIMSEWHNIRSLVRVSWRLVDLLDALSGRELFVDSYERSTSKRPTPAPSLHWMRRLVLLNGIRDPCMHWWLARTQAMLMRARTIPQTTEYGRSQHFTKCLDNCLSRFLASKPKRPSLPRCTGATNWSC